MRFAYRRSPCEASGMKQSLVYLFSVFLCLLTVSCAPSTPAARIAEKPLAFEKLSDEHKELVQRGEIGKGMDMSAVALAWGNPSSRMEGFRGKGRTERWEYIGTQPVMTNTFYDSYRYDRIHPHGYSRAGGYYGTEIVYVPYRKSTVWFIGGKVTEWERLK